MVAVKSHVGVKREFLNINKKNYDVNKKHKICVIGEGKHATYMVKELLIQGVNVTHFITTELAGNVKGIQLYRFWTGNSLRSTMSYAEKDGCDYFLSAFLGHKFPKKVVDNYKGRLMNFHPSLLPFYRGSSPIERMLDDEVYTGGVTIHLVDENYDTGDIIAQSKFDFRGSESRNKKYWAGSNYAHSIDDGARLFAYVLKNIKRIKPKSQKEVYETLADKIKTKDTALMLL